MPKKLPVDKLVAKVLTFLKQRKSEAAELDCKKLGYICFFRHSFPAVPSFVFDVIEHWTPLLVQSRRLPC